MFPDGTKVRVNTPHLTGILGKEGVIRRLVGGSLYEVTIPNEGTYRVWADQLELVGTPNEKYFLLVHMKGDKETFQECTDEDHAKRLLRVVLTSPVVDSAFIVRGEVIG